MELSAFWRARMARLPAIAYASSISTRAGVALACLGLALALAPLVISEYPLTAVVFAADETKPSANSAVVSRPASEKILQALATPTTVQFVERPLAEALDSVARDHNIVIRIDNEALTAAEVSLDKTLFLRIGGVSLRSVLYMLLEQDSLGFIVDGDDIVVTTRELADAHVEVTAYDLHYAVRAGVSLTDLGDAIVHSVYPSTWQTRVGAGRLHVEQTKLIVRQRADVQRRVQALLGDLERALVAVPGEFEIEPLETRAYAIGDLRKGVSEADLGNWLREVLLVPTRPDDLGGVDLTMGGDQMRLKQTPWVHAAAAKYLTAVRERRRQNTARPPTQDDFVFARNGMQLEANRQWTRTQLAKRLSVEFLDLPSEDALTFLKESGGVNIWMNHSECRRLRIRVDKPVTLKAADEPLSKLLDTVLMPLNLDWFVIEPGLIGVTAQPEDGPRMEPRVYGIQELRDAGHTTEGLIALITALDPGSWEATGSRGSMRPLAPGLLVVVQTRSVHDQIDKLFDRLMPVQTK
jgi:hypothetical protein